VIRPTWYLKLRLPINWTPFLPPSVVGTRSVFDDLENDEGTTLVVVAILEQALVFDPKNCSTRFLKRHLTSIIMKNIIDLVFVRLWLS
jgi:hypothetical protein